MEQAGFVLIGRLAADAEAAYRRLNSECETAFGGLASPLRVEGESASRAPHSGLVWASVRLHLWGAEQEATESRVTAGLGQLRGGGLFVAN